MGTNRSRLVALVVAGACGVAAVVGCSASGSSDVSDDTAPTDPTSPAAQLPPPSGSSTGAVDSGKPPKDAGKDSTVDAGPPPPVPGTPCTVVDEVRKKTCGACGQQETICLAGAGDAGSGAWSAYGQCLNELAGGCIPGTAVTEACGNCGTRTKTCTQYCAFTSPACAGEPPMSCVPGSVELSNAGCATGDTYHQRTCGSTCTSGNFSASCDAPPTTVNVGPTIGSVSSTIAILTADQTATRLGGSCPSATLTAATTVTPYVYLDVHNPLPSSVVVSIYNSLATGGAVVNTIMAAYASLPTTDVLRKACVKGVNNVGVTALTGDSSFASLTGTSAVTIPAGGTVTVYVAAYNPYVAATPALSTGKVKLNVKTDQIN